MPIRLDDVVIVEAAPQWDRRVAIIQVTDASERAMQLRVLVSAPDAGRAWELRCLVREHLIDFVRREWPQFLPRLRTEVQSDQPDAT